MQGLTNEKFEYNEELPTQLKSEWKQFREDLKMLNDIKIPRHVFDGKTPVSKEIHTFVDASENAYAAAIYLHAVHKDKRVTVQLLCAKSRLTPVNAITLPRLKLKAAVLGAQLTATIKEQLSLQGTATYFWADSEFVLFWINSPKTIKDKFVATRITTIQEASLQREWRHVPSENNAADIASSGISGSKFPNFSLWFYGPMFLYGPSSKWPLPIVVAKSERRAIPQENPEVLLATMQSPNWLYGINHGNSFDKLLRIVAYIMRFKRKSSDATTMLKFEELEESRKIVLRLIQHNNFSAEIKELKKCRMHKYVFTADIEKMYRQKVLSVKNR